jgi:hypothetical protein
MILKGKKIANKYKLTPNGTYRYTIIDIRLDSLDTFTDIITITYSLKNRINSLDNNEYSHIQKFYLSDVETMYEYSTRKFYEWLDAMERVYGKDNLTVDGEFNETFLIGTTGVLKIQQKSNAKTNEVYANVTKIMPNVENCTDKANVEADDVENFLNEI